MNHVKIKERTVIFFLEDAEGPIDHDKIINTTIDMLNQKIEKFIFDFYGVEKGFSSNLVGLVFALAKNISDCKAKVVFRGLSHEGIDMLKLTGLHSACPAAVIVPRGE